MRLVITCWLARFMWLMKCKIRNPLKSFQRRMDKMMLSWLVEVILHKLLANDFLGPKQKSSTNYCLSADLSEREEP